jgi:protein-ribulosamine 3-kinase
LRPQLELALKNGHATLESAGKRLCERLDRILGEYRPAASLLHGDLWSGNASSLADGTAVLFDPAVYYGDAEADLAMTELFGGFSQSFYAAYREIRPVDAGYGVRKILYNLYHVLNHANLFGGSYAAQAGSMIERLLATA